MLLKLNRGKTYSTMTFTVKFGETVEVDDETGKYLLTTGAFETVNSNVPVFFEQNVEAEKTVSEDADKKLDLTAEYVEGLKSSELDALALEHNIDISDCSNKKEKAEKIKGFFGLVNFEDLNIY